jgi:WD40 repeat protein
MATPNGLDPGGIDIFQLPSEHRVSQIHSDQAEVTTGMVMAVNLFHNTDSLVLISGYEDGRVMVHRHRGEMGLDGHWELITTIKSHTQPVLSLDVLPSKQHFIASGADATVARFSLTLAGSPRGAKLEKAVNTKHAGQQGLTVRSDGKIFATAGWDCRVRVYATKTLKELAVLKWHKVGCYTTAFANITPTSTSASASGTGAPANMSDEIVSSHTALDLIKRQREDKAQSTHWLAAGGKDGKISLWDIY